MLNRLRKSSSDRVISGVCGGIAEFFGISSTAVRIIFLFIPSNLLLYIILAIIIPEDYE